MNVILRDLPYFKRPTIADFQEPPIPIKSDQIMVWVGLTEGRQGEFDPRRPFFPAILDTGHSHNFSIQEDHLIRWAGLDPRLLPRHREVRIGGHRVPLCQADVWIRPNERGQRDRPAEKTPFRVALDWGIAVYPRTISNPPRLPLLGLRALRLAGLHLAIDCRQCAVTLRTARRFWFF